MILEVLLLVVLVVLLRWWLKRPSNLPPGPRPIPFLGSSFDISVDMVEKNRKKYGDIFRTEMGSTIVVYLCNYKLIKEALSMTEMSDRPYMEIMHRMSDGVEAGVSFANGQRWQNARRFLLRNLKDMGMGKTYLEEAIQKEAQMLVDELKQQVGTTSQIPKSLEIAVVNVVWQMVAGVRYAPDDKKVFSIIKILRSFEVNSIFMILELLPALKKRIPEFIRRNIATEKLFDRLTAESKKLCQEVIREHRATLDPDHPRDVVDEYLLAMDNNDDIAAYFSEMDLMRCVFDLFSAGFDTVSSTLRWFLLYIAKYPEVQRRVQQQIDDVVPRDTLPSYHHKPQLPLVEATVHEVLRLSSLVGIGVQRSNTVDVHLGGYFIPKDSMVFGCSVCCHMDPRHWDQPTQFRPDRFLTDEGKFVAQKEGFLPFGTGRRACLGEALARMELYIFTAALLQNFTIAAPDGCEVDLTPSKRLPSLRIAKDQKLIIKERKP